MPNKKFSQFTSSTAFSNMWLPGYDLSRPSDDQNVKLSVSTLQAAMGSVTSVVPIVTVTSNITLAAFEEVQSVQLNFPALTTTDVTALNIEFKSPTIAAGIYNVQLYAGSPLAGGELLFDYAATTGGINVGEDGLWDYLHPTVVYVPAAGGSNQIWARFISQDVNPVTLNARVITMEYAGNGAALPGWVDPPPYTGPLMTDVYVGPTRQFIEPRFGLQALADGGTMHIDPGKYYYPFGVTLDPTMFGRLDCGYNSGQGTAGYATRFVTGITIRGSGTYNATPTIFNGRGGFGMQASHPFRFIRGQGFLWCYGTNVTIEDIRFELGGGFDQDSDGEAAVYFLEYRTAPVTVHINRCAFDGCENGIFAQFWHSETPGETDISNATGSCKHLQINLDHCDFGYRMPNGCGGDGGSHDFYINCMTLNVTNSHFYGCLIDWKTYGLCPPLRRENTAVSEYAGTIVNPVTSGNNLKSRSRYVTISNCWIRSQTGKWIDRPEGGDTHVSNTVFSTIENSTGLCLAYNSEQSYPIPLSDVVFVGCTFHIIRERGYGSVWWNDTPSNKFDCSDSGNHIIWAAPNAGLVVNRTNSGYGPDLSAITGMTSEYVISEDGGKMSPSPTATFGPPPVAPLPASLASGDTLGPGIGPVVP